MAPATIRELLAEGQTGEAAQQVEAARTLWRGESWSGLDDLDPVHADRVVLESRRLDIEELGAQVATAAGDWKAARDRWDALVVLRPFQESWWCAAAEARAELGDRVEALRVLRRARAALGQAGAVPGPRLVALEQRLLGDDAPPLHRHQPDGSHEQRGPASLVDRVGAPSLLVAEKTAFVGRHALLDRLVEPRDNPKGSTLRASFVAGPAGIGKSRLAVEAARRCRSHIVLCGRSEQHAESTMGPFRQILDEYASSVSADQRRLDAGASGALLAMRLNSFGDLVDSSVQNSGNAEDAGRLVDAIADVLIAASVREPLLLVLDDLQWASPIALDTVRRLITRSTPGALTMIATYRPAVTVSDRRMERIVELTALPGCDNIELGPLAKDELVSLVDAAHAGVDPDELYRTTGGNPFFVSELLEPGVGDDRGSLLRLVAARVGRLHVEALHFVRLAALTGLEFDADLVGSAMRARESTRDTVVDLLTSNGLLLWANGGRRLHFAHGIVADAVLHTMDDAERRRLHLALAVAQQHRGRPATEIVANLLRAGSLVEATTLVACASEACEQLVGAGDARSASRIMRQVLDSPLPPESEIAAQRVLGVALLALSDPAAFGLLVGAHEAAVRLGLHREVAALALVYSTGGAWRRNSDRNGPRMLRIALDRCPENEPALRARLLARLEGYEIFSSTLTGRLESTGRALADARAVANPKAIADSLNARLVAISCPATLTETGRLEDEIRQLEDGGLARSELSNRPGVATYWRGDGARYRSDIATREAALSTSTVVERVLFDQLAACRAIHDGDVPTARAHNEAILDESTSAVYDVQKGNHLWNSVMIEWLDGDPTIALQLTKQRYDELRGAPLRYTLLWLAVAGGWTDVVDELRPNATPERIARLPELFLGGFGLGGLAMAARTLNDVRLATDLRPHLMGLSGQMIGVPWATYPSADFFLGVVAATLGDRSAAIAHFSRANDVHRNMRAPSFVELTEQELAALA